MGSKLYGFSYAPQALDYLKTIQAKSRRQIIAKIQALATDPYPKNSRVVRGRMDGENQVRRIRSGHYRALYSVRDNLYQIVILDIDHRKNVYR